MCSSPVPIHPCVSSPSRRCGGSPSRRCLGRRHCGRRGQGGRYPAARGRGRCSVHYPRLGSHRRHARPRRIDPGLWAGADGEWRHRLRRWSNRLPPGSPRSATQRVRLPRGLARLHHRGAVIPSPWCGSSSRGRRTHLPRDRLWPRPRGDNRVSDCASSGAVIEVGSVRQLARHDRRRDDGVQTRRFPDESRIRRSK
jgi:hypothetical protein